MGWFLKVGIFILAIYFIDAYDVNCEGETITNCNACNFDKDENGEVLKNCAEGACSYGFYYNGSKCEECHSTCSECIGPNEYDCLSCKERNEYYATSLGNNTDGSLKNTFYCLGCKFSFLILDGVGMGCIDADDYLTCKVCATELGYYLEIRDGYCEKDETGEPLNCGEMNTATKLCEKCESGYYRVQISNTTTSTYACVPCENSYANCATCDGTSVCATCKAGYIASSGKCVVNISNCIVPNTETECKICKASYYLKDNACVACARKNCFQCDGRTGDCSKCVAEHYLDDADKQCYPCINNCEKCSTSKTCDACKGGYELINENSECNNGFRGIFIELAAILTLLTMI